MRKRYSFFPSRPATSDDSKASFEEILKKSVPSAFPMYGHCKGDCSEFVPGPTGPPTPPSPCHQHPPPQAVACPACSACRSGSTIFTALIDPIDYPHRPYYGPHARSVRRCIFLFLEVRGRGADKNGISDSVNLKFETCTKIQSLNLCTGVVRGCQRRCGA